MTDPSSLPDDRRTPIGALPIHVVIVSYNRAADLRRCLASLARQDPPVASICVVDNGSTDGTLEMVRREHPGVELLLTPRNLGACVTRNAAAARSSQPVLWFLDSDAELRDADGAARLHALLMADPQRAAVGGEAVLDTEGRIVGVKRLRIGANAVVQGDTVGEEAGTTACQVIASCNLMVRREDFLAVGGFNPFYVFFYEDIELTWRLHQAGRTLVTLTPMPVVHHYSEAVRITNLWQESRNRMYFCLRNLAWPQVLALPLADVGFLLRLDNFRRLLRRARKPARAVSLVTAGGAAPARTRATAGRATALALRMLAMIALGYLAIPRVLLPALAARRRGACPPVVSALLRQAEAAS